MKRIIMTLTCIAGGAGAAFFGVRTMQSSSDREGFCREHGVLEARCFACDPTLVDKLGMCVEHGVPEARCWTCRPDVIAVFKALDDWCAGHGVPESYCTLCGDACTTGTSATTASAAPHDDDPCHDEHHDRAHLAPDSTSASSVQDSTRPSLTRMEQPPSSDCAVDMQRIRLAGPQVASCAGFQYATVQTRPVSVTLRCNAQLTYDQARFVRLGSRVSGVLSEVRVDLGDQVRAGDVVLVVESAELAEAKAHYLQTLASVRLWENNVRQETQLLEQSLASQRDVLEARTRLAEQRIELARAAVALRNLGFDVSTLDPVNDDAPISPLLEITAPQGGVIVERNGVAGETVEAGRTLLAIADTSRMWAMLDLYPTHAGQAAIGQKVHIHVEGTIGAPYEGVVTWISTQIDPRTRTLKARAELDNADGRLRANLFGQADLLILDERPLCIVPRTALQWDGCCNLVFVRVSDNEFEPRKVTLGHGTADWVEVRSGVSENESVVTVGSFLLKTEVLKNRIGAGCCPGE